ncbi:hypothetical protein Pelo_8900 [Pelomyxa schiedti]|nr:hypothetical protein Pelo_8900 [Pelomyxa schiedti]
MIRGNPPTAPNNNNHALHSHHPIRDHQPATNPQLPPVFFHFPPHCKSPIWTCHPLLSNDIKPFFFLQKPSSKISRNRCWTAGDGVLWGVIG